MQKYIEKLTPAQEKMMPKWVDGRMTQEELDFLRESNNIENEWSDVALQDAILAWKYPYTKWLFDLAIETHRILMQNLRPDIAGRLRMVSVTVGGNPTPKPELVRPMLLEWSGKWSERENLTEEEIKQSHIEFEKIHPFEDGNGRTGRIIYNRMLVKHGHPIQVITRKERFKYYQWFD